MASLLHPDHPLIDNILALSRPFPLNPVILEDTIGITRIADALIESSPKPNAVKQAACDTEKKKGSKLVVDKGYYH